MHYGGGLLSELQRTFTYNCYYVHTYQSTEVDERKEVITIMLGNLASPACVGGRSLRELSDEVGVESYISIIVFSSCWH